MTATRFDHAGLRGGQGNDHLTGSKGNDVYLFGTGDGADTIRNTGGGHDILKFDPVIDHDQLWFQQDGDDLLIDVLDANRQPNGDRITIDS